MKTKILFNTFVSCAAIVAFLATGQFANAQAKKPNILVIWGDDIGIHNISAYNLGIMGYHTPNIDRIAKEGALFTDAYAQQSCTAGRASFILGQHPFRTGLLTVGLPGSPQGIPDWAPTIADLLKQQGYATGQFGKNHLGDNNNRLPTVHGFDEFFGNLYHLNAEEEPETYYYPKDPAFKANFGPRGVLHSWATDKDDTTVEPRWGKVGKQKIEDTGPLTRERMPGVDEEFYGAAPTRSLSSSGLTPPVCMSGLTLRSPPTGSPESDSIPTAWSSTTPWSGRC
jgi:arylsulfatase